MDSNFSARSSCRVLWKPLILIGSVSLFVLKGELKVLGFNLCKVGVICCWNMEFGLEGVLEMFVKVDC